MDYFNTISFNGQALFLRWKSRGRFRQTISDHFRLKKPTKCHNYVLVETVHVLEKKYFLYVWWAAVFFFYPRKWKVPEKIFFGTFSGFFLERKFFSRPLFFNFLGQSEVFSGIFSYFFSGWIFFFLGQKLKNFEVFF